MTAGKDISISSAGVLKVVLIAPRTSQPRYHKRAVQLSMVGPVEVFAFKRKYYEENIFPSQLPFTSLGRLEDGRYLARPLSILKAIYTIRTKLKDRKSCLFYAMSLDCWLIARLCGITRGYYEVGDLRLAEGYGKFFRVIENLLSRTLLGFVLTSRFFYDHFYRTRVTVPKERVHIIDNKVNVSLAGMRPKSKRFSDGRVVIGLIGLLRYRRPIDLLLNFVLSKPESYVIECYGDGPLRGFVESRACENIRYHGSFKNPEELPKIYSAIELNFTVYDSSTRNVRLALPNKLFESAFFGVPIVCCRETSVGTLVEEWQIGKMVGISSPEEFEEDMSSIDKKWLQRCSINCFNRATSELLDDGEPVVRNMLSFGG